MLVDWKVEQGNALIEQGDAVIVTGPDAIYQEIIHRLETQALEWPFDTSIGLDFFDLMQSDEEDLTTIRAGLISQLIAVPGVLRVVFADVFIEQTRLKMTFGVLVEDDGEEALLTFGAETGFDSLGELMLLVTPTTGIAP